LGAASEMLNLLHVAPHVDAAAGGLAATLPDLCAALSQLEHDVTLCALARGALTPPVGYRCRTFPASSGPTRLGRSTAMHRFLVNQARAADVVHSHGLWMMPNIYSAWAAARARKPLVVSTHGMLNPVALGRSPALKKLFWATVQGAAVRSARLLHAASDREYHDIRAAGLTQPVAIVPNGVSIPPLIRQGLSKPVRTLLYVGRLSSLKGLDLLIDAWNDVAARFPEWELRIVGQDEGGYGARLAAKRDGLSAPRVTFAPPCHGAAKSQEFASADLVVLPSLSESFGMSVAEALAHGTPVIATTATPWSSLDARGCGWSVSPSRAALADVLQSALVLNADQLRLMGANGRDWMAEEFRWPGVADEMTKVYAWLAGDAPRPACVRTT
jgi:glycosyltransferase involved in cell wall biosynthesis